MNEQVFDLMFTLNANEEQLDYRTVYGSAKQGWMSNKLGERTDNITPLLDAIIDDIPEPAVWRGLRRCSSPRSNTLLTWGVSPWAR